MSDRPCPKCGHCDKCGRSNTPPAQVYPFPIYPQPYPNGYWPWTAQPPYQVWYGTTSVGAQSTSGLSGATSSHPLSSAN